VLRAAEKHGYKRDADLATVMAHVQARRPRDYKGNLVVIPVIRTTVSHFGITALWRGSNRTGTVTVFFDDNTQLSLGSFSSTSGSGAGTVNQTPDVFFGYVAPGGKAITRIDIIGDGFIRYDDLGFVVVPEPSYFAALAGVCGLGFVLLRRRSLNRS
jgi:hypothetical protein